MKLFVSQNGRKASEQVPFIYMEKSLSVPPKHPAKSNVLNYVQFYMKRTPLPALLHFSDTLGLIFLTDAESQRR